jgi:ammonia channel protein AmtB
MKCEGLNSGLALPMIFCITIGVVWLIKTTIGLRASQEEELQGLDIPEHGVEVSPEEEPVKA